MNIQQIAQLDRLSALLEANGFTLESPEVNVGVTLLNVTALGNSEMIMKLMLGNQLETYIANVISGVIRMAIEQGLEKEKVELVLDILKESGKVVTP